MPPLRFSGFTEPWEEKQLRSIGDTFNGLTGKSADDFGFGKPFVTYLQVFSRSTLDLSQCGEVRVLATERQNRLQFGDVILTTSSETPNEVGVASVLLDYPEELYLNSFCFGFRLNSLEDLLPGFAQFLFRSSHFRTKMLPLAQGSTRFNLSQTSFLAQRLNVPKPTEQQKIAGFLGAVDRWVAGLRARREALAEYKRGVMQRLFSRELRFTRPDGTPFPDWQEKRLGDMAEINPPSRQLPSDFIYIDLDAVQSGRLLRQTRIRRKDAPSRAQRVLAKGDILFQTVRPYQKNNLIFDLSDDAVASTGYAQIRPDQDGGFLFQLIQSDEFVSEVLRRTTGSNYPAINPSDLSSITLPVPHPEEQRKIAGFLGALDRRIDAVTAQITTAEAFKRGLLQQMFV